MQDTQGQDAALELRDGESPDELMARLSEEGAQEGADTDGAEAPPETAKITLGEAEYSLEELATLVADGKRAQEIERGGREKFETAAARQRELDAREQEIADMRTIWDAFRNGSPAERQMLVEALAQEAGVTPGGADAPTQINEADLTENELALHRYNQSLRREIDQMRSAMSGLSQTVQSIREPLEEIRQYTNSEKEARQIQADIAAIKEKTGHTVSGEQIKLWRDNGIADPVKAVDVLLPMLAKATRDGAQKARKQEEIPVAGKSESLDPNDPSVSPDELFREHMRKNHVPGW